MPIVTKPNTFTANQIIDANQMNQNFDSIYGLVNGSLDAANLAVNAINDSSKMANEIVLPSKSKGLVYGSDLYGQNWVVAGGLATFSGSPVNQIQVNTVSANILQVDGTYRHVSVAGTSYTTSALSSTYFLDLQPDGTASWATTHSAQAGYLPLATVTTNGSGNVGVVTDVRVLSAGIAWLNISKVSSSLADLATRNASDLTGTLAVARLPTAIPAINIGNGDVDNTKLSYLNSVTSNVQTQLNSKVTPTTGTGNPNGVLTPTVIGQFYTDTNTGLIYTATALTNTSWIIPIPYNAMTQQAIINAAMEVWQQGITFTNPANSAYTADMWLLIIGSGAGTLPTTIVHSQATLTPGELYNAKYAYNINVNGAGSGFGSGDRYGVRQKIEFGTSKLCGNGKKITVSFYAKSSIASKQIGVGVTQFYGTGGSPSSSSIVLPVAASIRTLTSSMVLYTFTFPTVTLAGKIFGTNNDDYLEVTIYSMWGAGFSTGSLGGPGVTEDFRGAGDITFTEVVVNAGDTALPFQPKSFAQEMLDCMRYFEKSYNYADAIGASTYVGSVGNTYSTGADVTVNIGTRIAFKVRKRVTPTLTAYDTVGASGKVAKVTISGGVNNGITPFSLGSIGDSNFEIIVSGAPAACGMVMHYVADARL